MTDPRSLLATYFRQQAELSMPAYIFSSSFDPKTMSTSQGESYLKTIPQSQQAPESVNEISSQYSTNIPDSKQPENDSPTVKPGSSIREKLVELYNEFKECHQCPLSESRQNFIFGSGNAEAPLMIIGEAPGADEDRQGLPFVGKAGQLLTKMLAAINLDRKKDVFITNVLKCRPPQNRNPESAEITLCLPLLKRQIEIISPKAILLLGRIAAHSLLETAGSISELRKTIHVYTSIPVVVTYHPAALLRNEQYKHPAWDDLQRLEKLLKERGEYGS